MKLLPLLPSTTSFYLPKCINALQPGSKASYGCLLLTKWVGSV